MSNGFGLINQPVINKSIDSCKTTSLNYDSTMRCKFLGNNDIKQLLNGFKVDDELMWLSTTNFRNIGFISLGY